MTGHELFAMAHAGIGLISIFLMFLALIELLHLSPNNIKRLRRESVAILIFTLLTFIVASWVYIYFYSADKAVILLGEWSWAHTFFMETKEHGFFILLLLAIYFPILVYKLPLLENRSSRNLALGVLLTMIALGFFMEVAGGIISMAIRLGLT